MPKPTEFHEAFRRALEDVAARAGGVPLGLGLLSSAVLADRAVREDDGHACDSPNRAAPGSSNDGQPPAHADECADGLPRLPAGRFKHCLTDRQDLSRLFRNRNKVLWRHESKLRMSPANESLKADQRTALERHDGLVIDEEFVSFAEEQIKATGGTLEFSNDLNEAVEGVDVAQRISFLIDLDRVDPSGRTAPPVHDVYIASIAIEDV